MESKYDYIVFPKNLGNKLFVECIHHIYQNNNNKNNSNSHKIPIELDDGLYNWIKEKFKNPIGCTIHVKYKTKYYANRDSQRELKFHEISNCVLKNGKNLGCLNIDYFTQENKYTILDLENIDDIALQISTKYIETNGDSDGLWDVAEVPLRGHCLIRIS